MEGYEPHSEKYRREGEKLTPPLYAYPHSFGVSVTGGYVYRGSKSPSFEGVYIFGDYETRRVWGTQACRRQSRIRSRTRRVAACTFHRSASTKMARSTSSAMRARSSAWIYRIASLSNAESAHYESGAISFQYML